MKNILEKEMENLEKTGTKVFRAGKDYDSMKELINLLNTITKKKPKNTWVQTV